MGVGMIVVVTPEETTKLIQYLGNKHLHAYEVGQIIEDEDRDAQKTHLSMINSSQKGFLDSLIY